MRADSGSDRRSLGLGLGLIALFLVMTDGAIWLWSPQPWLFGILDTYITRFEETLLYLPVVRNWSFAEPLLADFTGLRAVHMLAPFPYIVFAITKLLSLVAGGTLNGTVLAIHSLVLVGFWAAFRLCRQLTTSASLAMITALLMVFGFDEVQLAAGRVNTAASLTIPVLAGAAGAMMFATGYVMSQRPGWLRGLFLFLFTPAAGVAYAFAVQQVTATPFLADISATRFFSPLLPLGFLYLTLFSLLAVDQQWESGKPVRLWFAGLVLGFVANFYVYFANWLIMAPIFGLWLVWQWRAVFAYRRFTLPTLTVGAAFTGPFLVTLVEAKTLPAMSDYLYRAGNFGIARYHRFNFPPLYALWGNLLIIAGLILVLRYGLRRRRVALSSQDWVPLGAYSLSVLAAYANYWLGEVIPQALLLHRYWIPLAVLSILTVSRHIEWRMFWRRPSLTFAVTTCLFGSVGMMAVGRWQAHAFYSGPAMAPLAATATAVAAAAAPDEVLVSDWQSLVVLAPAFGLKTLCPNPIMTIATHSALVDDYAAMSRLLDRTPDEFIRFVGDIDRWPETYENQSSAAILMASLTQSVAYPMPPPWVESHRDDMMRAYQQLSVESVLARIPLLLLCLRTGEPQAQLVPSLTYLGPRGDVRCWRRAG